MKELKNKIESLANLYHQEIVAVRRHLHQYPELSFQEVETGKYIASLLAAYDIPHEHGWGGNGVVAIIKGKNPDKKTIALRADIDALPIQEANEVPYKSKHPGIMHACGHDVHTASLLGVAKILNELKEEFEGQVKLIFQPGEEKLPGGASILIKEGVLQQPTPENILGQHVHPPLEVGKVGFRAGKYMASTDEIYITVEGKGGHGALPQNAIDPILMASHLIVALQQIVSRRANPSIPSVLTLGKINSVGGATNVIPNAVKIQGTFRTMDEDWRTTAHEAIRNLAVGLIESMGGKCDVEIKKGYPSLINNDELTHQTRKHAEDYLGSENVVELPIRMTGEDFSFYAQVIPGCFYRLGVRSPQLDRIPSVHTNLFDVDEDCLKHGMGLMAWLAVCQMQ